MQAGQLENSPRRPRRGGHHEVPIDGDQRSASTQEHSQPGRVQERGAGHVHRHRTDAAFNGPLQLRRPTTRLSPCPPPRRRGSSRRSRRRGTRRRNRQQCSTSRSPTSTASRLKELMPATRPKVAPALAVGKCRPTPEKMRDASRMARPSWIHRNRKPSPGAGATIEPTSINPHHSTQVATSPRPAGSTRARHPAIDTDRTTSARPTTLYAADDDTSSRNRRRHRSHHRPARFSGCS
jgi:hypothetical protein